MEHEHSQHGAHSSHSRDPGAKQQHPDHGSYIGHAIPGTMFLIWSLYWLFSICDIHLRRRHWNSAQRHTFSRKTHHGLTAILNPNLAWYPWPYWPPWPYAEPLIKVVMSLLGVLVEIWIGWGFKLRPMYEPDGHFAMFHINNWQHALMYGGYAVSGLVDLLGTATSLPRGTEQAFISLAFLSETLLMGLHAKHNPLDKVVHQLLTGLMVGSTLATGAEVAVQGSFMLALTKTLMVFLQGTWFWHVGRILFLDNWAWDMTVMSSTMFIPVVFTLHILISATFLLIVYVTMRLVYIRCGLLPHHHGHKSSTPGQGLAPEVELADLEAYPDAGPPSLNGLNGWPHESEGHGLLGPKGWFNRG